MVTTSKFRLLLSGSSAVSLILSGSSSRVWTDWLSATGGSLISFTTVMEMVATLLSSEPSLATKVKLSGPTYLLADVYCRFGAAPLNVP